MDKESQTEDLQSKLGKLSQRIKELRSKAESFGEGLSKEYREQLEGLKERNTRVREKLKVMQEKGEKAPEKIRSETEEMINKLGQSYQELKKKLTIERGVEMEVDKTQLISVQNLIGMRVIDSAANDFGSIDDVFINIQEGTIEEVVIKTGIRRQKHQIQASEIEKIGDKVILNIEREEVKERSREE